jgi:hypothetical protein
MSGSGQRPAWRFETGTRRESERENLFCLKSRSDKFTDFSERPRSGSLKNAAVDFLITFSSRKK